MRQTADPDFELSWRAALWAAATLTVVTGVGIVLYSNLRLFGYGTMLAGLVASLCCGYYEHASNSAVVGVVLVSLVVLPLFWVAQLFQLGVGVGDALFVTTSFGLAWLAVVAIVFLPVAYLSATVGDFARKKVGGRIGYNT
jgi:hypothetical protein